jgi:hypothetical protein
MQSRALQNVWGGVLRAPRWSCFRREDPAVLTPPTGRVSSTVGQVPAGRKQKSSSLGAVDQTARPGGLPAGASPQSINEAAGPERERSSRSRFL